MRLLRRLIRLILLPLWIIVFAICATPVRYLMRKDASERTIAKVAKYWGIGLAWILGYRLHIHGDRASYLEKGGLLMSNHQSYMDVFLNSCLFGCRFTPKAEVRKWPFFGWYVGLSRPIWIDRKNKKCSEEIMEESRRTLMVKIPLVVYPEGTTTDGRHGLLPFKTTFFETVVGTDIPIQPLINVFHPKAGDCHPSWYSDMTFLPHLWAVLGNHVIDTDIYILPMIQAGDMNRKELAAKTHEIMQAAYQKYYVPDDKVVYLE